MGKQNVGGLSFSSKKERSTDTCYDMDEPWRHYIEWNKPDTEDPHIVWLHLYELSKRGKSIESESGLVVAEGFHRGGFGRNGVMTNGYNVSLWGDENVPKLWRSLYNSEHTKTYRTVHFKPVDCMICELYLNTAVIKRKQRRSIAAWWMRPLQTTHNLSGGCMRWRTWPQGYR